MTKLRAGTLALVLIGAAAFSLWQHQQIKRLTAEQAVLRDQVEHAASQQDEIQRLAARSKATVEASEAGRSELMRLRAQSSRLRLVEQENAQLKIERQRLAGQVSRPKQADTASTQEPNRSPTADTATPSLPPGVTDLGVIELSNGTPMRLELGEGKECVVTTTVLNDGQLQMVFTSESKTADGLTIQQELTATVLPDQQMMSVIDGVEVALTPTLKSK